MTVHLAAHDRPDPLTLRRAWLDALASPRPARARDLAARLGVSEGELMASRVGLDAIRLCGPPRDLLRGFGAAGRVMALTRNDHAVIEKEGRYTPVSFSGEGAREIGLVLDEGVDLRLFMGRWRHAFAAPHGTPKGDRWGVHFFDGAGVALHKVYTTEVTDSAAFWALFESHRAADARPGLAVSEAAPASAPSRELDSAGVAEFRAAWLALEDTHDFYPLLRRFGLRRTDALALAPEGMAREVEVEALNTALTGAAAAEVPIMVFVGNPGCIEIHTGPVRRIVRRGAWLNVLDAGFNLHVHEPGLARAFVVRKPTRDGDVTSLEVFDAAGEAVVTLFGARKPGIPEDPRWRALVRTLA